MIHTQRALIKMPEVVGLGLRKAELLLKNAGLQIEAVLYRESYDERNTVLEQRPARGQMVYAGEKVSLWISRESYMRWLPSIYQRSDPAGRNFVRDLLWITQHLLGAIEDRLDVIHTYFDPYEAPAEFLPWLASWTSMIVDEDWPIEKKRLLIKKAIELYKIRGTVKGLKLFIALFTDHEPEIVENAWPFRGFRIGVTSGIAIDSIILPPVHLAHAFIVEMPVTYKDVSIESVIRLHEIIQLEKPSHTSYYLRFLAERRPKEMRDFPQIAVRSGIGIGQEVIQPLPEGGLVWIEEHEREQARERTMRPADMPRDESVEELVSPVRGKLPLDQAPRADTAPVEGHDVRTNLAGGFDQGAREMQALTTEELEAALGAPPEAADTGDDAGSGRAEDDDAQ